MKGYIYTGLLALFCLNQSCAAKNVNTEDPTLRMLYYGLTSMEDVRAMNAVARKYGFTYYAAAGCVVSASLVDSIHRENAATSRILAARFGKDWRKQFDADVKATKALYWKIEKLVKKEPYIIEKNRQQQTRDHYLGYLIEPLTAGGEYEVKAYTFDVSDEGVAKIIWYKMKVDLTNNKVSLLSSKAERLAE